MEHQEIEAELAAAHDLIESTSAAHLAYVGTDGTPRVVPVGVFWTGKHFVVSTATTAPKVAALSQRPEVALSIEQGDAPSGARALSVRGVVDLEIVDGVVDEYLAASRKSMAADEAAEFERSVRATYDQMVRIAITPLWARYYDFAVGRMPRFLQELVARNAR